jgi:hypothetical protein
MQFFNEIGDTKPLFTRNISTIRAQNIKSVGVIDIQSLQATKVPYLGAETFYAIGANFEGLKFYRA